MSGTAVAQLITVLVSPIITRLYGPEAFGVFAVYASVVAMFGAFASLRYSLAIPLPDTEREAQCVFLVAYIAATVLAIGVLVHIVFAGPGLADLLGAPELAPLLWLVPVGFLAESARVTSRYRGVRQKNYRLLGQNDGAQALVRAGGQLGGGLLVPTAGVLIGGDVLARVLAAAILHVRTVPSNRHQIRARELLAAAWRFRKFPLLGAPAAALNSCTLYLPTIMLARHYGLTTAGIYGLTQRVIAAPLLLLSNALLEAYYGAAAARRRSGEGLLGPLFVRTVRFATVASVAVFLPLGLLASFAVGPVFGHEWADAGRYIRILLPMYVIRFIANAVGPTLAVLERQGLQLFREVTRFVLIIGGLLLVITAGGSITSALLVLSASGVVGYLVYIFTAWRSVKRADRTLVRTSSAVTATP